MTQAFDRAVQIKVCPPHACQAGGRVSGFRNLETRLTQWTRAHRLGVPCSCMKCWNRGKPGSSGEKDSVEFGTITGVTPNVIPANPGSAKCQQLPAPVTEGRFLSSPHEVPVLHLLGLQHLTSVSASAPSPSRGDCSLDKNFRTLSLWAPSCFLWAQRL